MVLDYGLYCKNLLPWLVFAIIASITINQVLVNDLNWHKQEVYDSWERQAKQDFDYQQKINNLEKQVVDLNIQNEVCKVVLIYEKDKELE